MFDVMVRMAWLMCAHLLLVSDPGSSNSGYYELLAVLTHKGRSSSSGHYLGWVRHRGNEWLKMDDDKVSVVLEEDVLKLSGGGRVYSAAQACV